jgi:hypothetical protein
MSSNNPIQQLEDPGTKSPAPIIPMHPEGRNTLIKVRGEMKIKIEKGPPLFYSKPIYKTRKHDLL